jgi:hypothetical protein
LFVRGLTSILVAAVVIAVLSGSTGSVRAQEGLYASMAVDLVADGHPGDVQSGRSLTSGSFDVEFEIDGVFGPTGVGTFAFDLNYPQELIVPSGDFRVNGAWSESGGGQTICFLLQRDIGDGVARLACNLAESLTGATQPGVMATMEFTVVPGASGCGELTFEQPEVALANAGNQYEFHEARGAAIAVNRSDCPGVLDATPAPGTTPGANPTPGSGVVGPADLTATAAAENGTPLDTPVPTASPAASAATQTVPPGTQGAVRTASPATTSEPTRKPVLGPTELAVNEAAQFATVTAAAAARATKPSSGSNGNGRLVVGGIALVAVALLGAAGAVVYNYRKRS